jgi:hypothetical protein
MASASNSRQRAGSNVQVKMRYFIEINEFEGHYKIAIHKGNPSEAVVLPSVVLGQNSEVSIKGVSYKLGQLLQALISYQPDDLKLAFDERGQLEIGQFLFTKVLGGVGIMKDSLVAENRVEVRIVTKDEFIARLPWVLLANEGIFLSTTGWSIALSTSTEVPDCELDPSPRMLVATPQPDGVSDTKAKPHLDGLEVLFSAAATRLTEGRNLRVVKSWEAFKEALTGFRPHIIYYYGHGIGDFNSSRLVFAAEKGNSRVDVPVADVAICLRQMTGGPPQLVYLNCCLGDSGGVLGAGRQLGGVVPAVITNSTMAQIAAAQSQALTLWRSMLLDGIPPHSAIAEMRSKMNYLDFSVGDVRWMTPVLHCHYLNWRATPLRNKVRKDLDPYWQFKLDRVRQFSLVYYQTTQMLRGQGRRCLAYVWYGQEGQGIDLFHKRLKYELQVVLTGVYVYEVRPEWPIELKNPHRSFEDMLIEAFDVDSMTDIPGRIRAQTRNSNQAQVLVYIRHLPVGPGHAINPETLRKYIEWLAYNFLPLLEDRTFALLGVSFLINKPQKFYEALKAWMRNFEHPLMGFQILDEMERLVMKDLLDFIDSHNIYLPKDRRDQVLKKILDKTQGHYEMTLDALKDLVESAWTTEIEAAGTDTSRDFDY